MGREMHGESYSANKAASIMDVALVCPECHQGHQFDEERWENCQEDPDTLFRALKAGRVRGIVAIIGCTEKQLVAAEVMVSLATELLKRDMLLLVSDCTLGQLVARGLSSTTAFQSAGHGLVECCDHLDIAPIVCIGSCEETYRIGALGMKLATSSGIDLLKLPMVTATSDSMQKQEAALLAQCGTPLFTVETDPVHTANSIETHIHKARLTLHWFDRYHCRIHS